MVSFLESFRTPAFGCGCELFLEIVDREDFFFPPCAFSYAFFSWTGALPLIKHSQLLWKYCRMVESSDTHPACPLVAVAFSFYGQQVIAGLITGSGRHA